MAFEFGLYDRPYHFSVCAGWSPCLGTYIYDIHGKELPTRLVRTMDQTYRLGLTVMHTVRVFKVRGRSCQIVARTTFRSWEEEAKLPPLGRSVRIYTLSGTAM